MERLSFGGRSWREPRLNSCSDVVMKDCGLEARSASGVHRPDIRVQEAKETEHIRENSELPVRSLTPPPRKYKQEPGKCG